MRLTTLPVLIFFVGAAALFACSRNAEPQQSTPVSSSSGPAEPQATPAETRAAAGSARPAQTPTGAPAVAATSTPVVRPASPTPAPTAGASTAAPAVPGVTVQAAVPAVATPSPAPAAPAIPPEGISRNQWAADRVTGMRDMFALSAAASDWLSTYDFRQMYGQPAWFGSYGYGAWAGAGEAQTRIIAHEMSHSYWGLFPVPGRPDLTWERDQDGLTPAMRQYREDLKTFMSQPPDRYEPLRDRFRNFPNLTRGDYPDLWHSGEADILNFTGGNISLLPPILRKYWQSYLTAYGVFGRSGPANEAPAVADWPDAIAWWQGLPGDQRRAAAELFGLQHFPLYRYEVAPRSQGLPERSMDLFENDELQRLVDFAEQFDVIRAREFALVDAAGVNRGFSFWQGYLSDKKDLHQRHPEALNGHADLRARSLGAALDFYVSIDRLSSASQAEAYRARSASSPEIRELAVLLKARAIVELFAAGDPGDTGIRAVLGFYAQKLAPLAGAVDRILAEGRRSPQQGAIEMAAYIGSLSDNDLRSDSGLIFSLLRETEQETLNRVMPALDDATLLRMLRVTPATARSPEVGPERLLAAVGVRAGASEQALIAGARTLAEFSSGNYAIDGPYEMAVFDAIEKLGQEDPAAALRVVSASGMRVDPWLERGSTEMLLVLDRAQDQAARLVAGVQGLTTSPQRVLHRLSGLDPDLAADLLVQLADLCAGGGCAGLEQRDTAAAAGVIGPIDRDWDQIVPRALLEMGFDAYYTDVSVWPRGSAGPGVAPGLGARFLAELEAGKGQAWLDGQFDSAVALARAWTVSGEFDPQFESQWRATLSQAAASSSGAARAVAERLLSRMN